MPHSKLGRVVLGVCWVGCGCDPGQPPQDSGTDAYSATDAYTVSADAMAAEDAGRRASVWTCLGEGLAWPDPIGANATFELTFIDIDGPLEGPPLDDATVDACASGEMSCPTPISTGMTAGLGRVELTVPTPGIGWDGFFRVTSAGHAPTYLFLHPPVWFNGVRWGGPWVVPEISDLATWAGGLSSPITLDPARGHALVLTADCCYLDRGSSPGCAQSDTDELAVTIDGVAPAAYAPGNYFYGFFNLEPGPATVEARMRSTGDVVGRAEIFIVAAAFSETVIGPTPIP